MSVLRGTTVLATVLRRFDRIHDRIVGHCREHSLLGDAVLAAVIVFFLAVNVGRTSLDAGIKKIHGAGVAGVGTNSLHDGEAAIERAFDTWEGGFERLGALLKADAVVFAQWQTVLELILVPFSLMLGYTVIRTLRTRAKINVVRLLLEFAAGGLLLYAGLGVVNQGAELWILAERRSVQGLDSVLHVSGIVRAALLPLVLIPIVVALIHTHRTTPPEERFIWWRGTTTTYRILIVVVVLHAVLLLFSIPGAQAEDGLRLWMEQPSLAFIGLGFTAMLSLSLAAIALGLGTNAHPKRVVLDRTATSIVVVVGLVVSLLGALSYWLPNDRPGWSAGVLGAGVLVLVVALLSLPLVSASTPQQQDGSPDPSAAAELSSVREQEIVPVWTSSDPAPAVAEPTTSARRLAPGVLALAPLTVLTLCLVRASVPSLMDSKSSGGLIFAAAAAGVLAIGAFCSARIAARWADGAADQDKRRRWFFRTLAVIALVCAVTYGLVVADPWRWAPQLGLAAIIATFFTALVVVFGMIDLLTASKALPAAFDFVGLRRFPIVISLVAWGLVSHSLADPGYHDLKTIEGSTLPDNAQATVQGEVDKWVAANLPESIETNSTAGARPGVPMVFVAAAGGGIKAAAFTAATLDCTFVGGAVTSGGDGVDEEPLHPCTRSDVWSRLFAASGASGGSVGIASVIAELHGSSTSDTWVKDRLGRDLLSPELAWQVFVEVPNAVMNFNPGTDRGEILQESWRRAFTDGDVNPGGAPFYAETPDAWSGPLVYFSGTNLNDGCRVNISRVRSAANPNLGVSADGEVDVLPSGATRQGSCKDERVPSDATAEQPDPSSWAPDQAGTRDLTDYLCSAETHEPGSGENIELATAAFLSARFPFVSPTGTVRCPDSDSSTTSDSLSIGDAGYRDNSGAASLMDAWAVLEPIITGYNRQHTSCIVPIFVEINNGYGGYSAPRPSSDVAQLLAPALGAAKVFGDLSYGPIEQAAAEFSRPLAPDIRVRQNGSDLATRFFRISLVDNPGVTAPLGWSLSDNAVGDLVDQLDLEENRSALTSLRDLLDPIDGRLTCETTDP